MTKIILVDGNSIGFASHHGTLLTANGMQVQAVFGFIRTMRQLVEQNPKADIIVLWDGKAKWRYDLLPEYKGNRNSNPKMEASRKAYKEQVPYIAKALEVLGVKQAQCSTHEADDLAGLIVKKVSNSNLNKPNPTTIHLITGDRDWLQLVRPNVSWQDIREVGRYVSHKTFYEQTGYKTPYAFLQGKALQGDSSDNIPPVGGIGEKKAVELLARFDSVEAFINACNVGEYVPKNKAERSLWLGKAVVGKDEWEQSFVYIEDPELTDEANEERRNKMFKNYMNEYVGQARLFFERNMKLMQLIDPVPPESEALNINKGKYDEEAFKEFCAEFAFMSILNSFDVFVKPFKERIKP